METVSIRMVVETIIAIAWFVWTISWFLYMWKGYAKIRYPMRVSEKYIKDEVREGWIIVLLSLVALVESLVFAVLLSG